MRDKCIICNSRVVNPSYKVLDNRFGIEDSFEYKTCINCSHIQLYPIIESNKLEKFYNNYYNSIEKSSKNKYSYFRSKINNSVIRKLYNQIEGDITFGSIKGNGRLLEVGCNEGKNLNTYFSNGYEVYGLETNIVAAKEAKKLGFKIFFNEINDLPYTENFDVIVMPNVLEHILDPLSIIDKINIHLNVGGELWISLPNSNSIYRKVFKGHWINWHPPFHISQFNLSNINQMLNDKGLSIISMNSVSPAQWISMSIISVLFFKKGQPTKMMRNPLLLSILMILIKVIFFIPIYIFNKFMMGDCLKIVAKKVD